MEIPFKVAELDHLVLRCRDQARMLDFYTRVLGLHEERRLDAIGLIQLRAGASLIDLVPAASPPSAAGANVDHFCLGVAVGDLAAHGNDLLNATVVHAFAFRNPVAHQANNFPIRRRGVARRAMIRAALWRQ